MFGRAVENFVRRELLAGVQTRKLITRAVVTSQSLSNINKSLENESDIVIASKFTSIKYPDFTLDQYVWEDVNHWDHKTALVDGITERFVTYGQLRDYCRALAIRLQTVFHLKHGDTIALCLPNSIEFPIVCLAGSECGLIVTTVNPIYTAGEFNCACESFD